MTTLLAGEIGERQPVLEIGVGTGLVSLPLHEAGVRMVGLDLSSAMVGKLVEKSGGRSPFPIVLGSATELPFDANSFGAALARHVLHLIPAWPEAVRELGRVIRPGGVLLLNIGIRDTGVWSEIDGQLEGRLGVHARRVGLEPEDVAELDAEIERFGGRVRELPLLWQQSELTLERYFDETAEGIYSWTWDIDAGELADAIATTSAWALERFGRLDEVLEPRFPIAWRAYDVTG
jgi:SAM-dependent methyltransferase